MNGYPVEKGELFSYIFMSEYVAHKRPMRLGRERIG